MERDIIVREWYLELARNTRRWDDAVIHFCCTRYPLAFEPVLVKILLREFLDIYPLLPKEVFSDDATISAIYRAGQVDCYSIGVREEPRNADIYSYMWRNPNTGEYFIPKE